MANTAAYRGLRWGELIALTIPQLDQAARVITVDRKSRRRARGSQLNMIAGDGHGGISVADGSRSGPTQCWVLHRSPSVIWTRTALAAGTGTALTPTTPPSGPTGHCRNQARHLGSPRTAAAGG